MTAQQSAVIDEIFSRHFPFISILDLRARGMRFKDIGAQLGISTQAAWSRYQTALKGES